MPEVRRASHRYCARLVGSVFDGEDIVQDTLLRAYAAIAELDPATPLKPWLFRIAHNRAIDHLRSQAMRQGEPFDATADIADADAPDPLEMLMRQEAVGTAMSRFLLLPIAQRSAVILKDLLGHSIEEIAELLDLTVNAVKAALHRGRRRLQEINATPYAPPAGRIASAEATRYAALFNQRNWDMLRSLLADDVRLNQTARAERVGKSAVEIFFTFYAAAEGWRVAPARVEGREVIAVFEGTDQYLPSYLMEIAWREGRIAAIRDFRHARYIAEGAEIVLASAEPANPG
ncbi:MAG: sigma-70 family RNA polymerase sigma factor [Alphaproteobacteria bacterium]|nr:sigma-70 family RNA polymerase sigma factor [Alphaproteobacteria bacterium]